MVIQAFLIGPGVQELVPTLQGLLDDPNDYRLIAGADAKALLSGWGSR
jgi:flagellar biosynthetic protein FlhB